MKTHPLSTIIPLAIVCSLLIGYQYLGAAWSEPGSPGSSDLTGTNVDAPINVGSDDQIKSAALGVDALYVYGDIGLDGDINNLLGTTSAARVHAANYCDENGQNCVSTVASGSGMGEFVPGWPNFIRCDGAFHDNVTFRASGEVVSAYGSGAVGQVQYRGGVPGVNDLFITFDAGGTNVTTDSAWFTGGNCLRDIAQYVTDGDTF